MIKLVPMDDLIDQLESGFPGVEWEADREWLWITTDLAPHRNKCACEQCVERAAIRKGIGKQALGFLYAKNGHTLPSGAVSFWGNHCQRPQRFARRSSKTKGEPQTDGADNQPQTSDAELMALIGG